MFDPVCIDYITKYLEPNEILSLRFSLPLANKMISEWIYQIRMCIDPLTENWESLLDIANRLGISHGIIPYILMIHPEYIELIHRRSIINIFGYRFIPPEIEEEFRELITNRDISIIKYMTTTDCIRYAKEFSDIMSDESCDEFQNHVGCSIGGFIGDGDSLLCFNESNFEQTCDLRIIIFIALEFQFQPRTLGYGVKHDMDDRFMIYHMYKCCSYRGNVHKIINTITKSVTFDNKSRGRDKLVRRLFTALKKRKSTMVNKSISVLFYKKMAINHYYNNDYIQMIECMTKCLTNIGNVSILELFSDITEEKIIDSISAIAVLYFIGADYHKK